MLAHTFNQHDSKLKIIVTTHSPYVLSSFNNLIEAGNIIEKDNIKAIDVYKTIPYEEVLFSKDLNAYSINKGEKKNIIDEETQLISQNSLDDVSNEISKIFGELLDIEYGEY
jgi:predicted ATP-binding protein involved in virulence